MENFIGMLRQQGQNGIVELDRNSPEFGRQIRVPRRFLNGAPFNMKVVCALKGTDREGEPYAEIIEVLGDEGNPDTAILAIMRYYQLPEAFPQAVQEAAEQFPRSLNDTDIQIELASGRKDLRHLHTITVDGEDAKDLDDAIDLEITAEGHARLYVHIADVAHYVTEGSALDAEAAQRGNSIYLVDRVLPMYPARLSNGLCSLNPEQDRLALTAELIIDERGKTLSGQIYSSLIRSKVRTSYRETQAILDGEAVSEDRPDWFAPLVRDLATLTERLQAARKQRGALNFEFPETVVQLDAQGHPTDIFPAPELFTHHLIEAFMIAANEFVATLAEKHHIPIIYRVHELPDPEKIEVFRNLARRLGIRVRLSEEPRPGELAEVLEQIKDEPFAKTLGHLLLRSLAKARYSERNLGHFGLASESYCHFTAPIRRYSDTVTHRELKKWLVSREKGAKQDFQRAFRIAGHCSETERIAIDAERDTVAQKAAEYYAEHLGEIYPGVISGFAPASFFVELESSVEGAVFFRSLDGYYHYEPDQMMAVNQATGSALAIGDQVKVQIAAVDINRRFIDFKLIEHRTARAQNAERSRTQEKPPAKYEKKSGKRAARDARPGPRGKRKKGGIGQQSKRANKNKSFRNRGR